LPSAVSHTVEYGKESHRGGVMGDTIWVREMDLADALGRFELDTDLGSVTILGEQTDRLTVKVTRRLDDLDMSEIDRLFPIEIEENGNHVRLTARLSDKAAGVSEKRARFEVRLPKGFDLSIRTSGGKVNVESMVGRTDIKTSGGSIGMQNSGGEVVAKTSGGTIEVDGGRERVELKSSGGSIRLKNAIGAVDAVTSGGRIQVDVKGGPIRLKTSGGSLDARIKGPLAGDCDLSTSGGSVAFRCDATSGFDLGAKTKGGSVSCDLPMEVLAEDRRSLEGVVNGGGHAVSLQTSGGSISVGANQD
jgi:DUF4097 and DUF4098 domain-containing protein YvlB